MFVQDPSAVLDYTVDWAQWMPTPDGLSDSIVSSTWTADSGLTIETTPAPTNDTANTTVWIGASGQDGRTYSVTNRITTQAGRQTVCTFTICLVAGSPGDADRTYTIEGDNLP